MNNFDDSFDSTGPEDSTITSDFALGQAYASGFKWACKEMSEDIKSILDTSLTEREKLARILFLAMEAGRL